MTIWPCIRLVRVASCTRDLSCLGHGHSAAPAPSYPDPRIVSSLQEKHRKFHWGLYWRLSGQVYHGTGQQYCRHCSAPETQRCPPRRAKEETLRYVVVLCFFYTSTELYRMCRYIHPALLFDTHTNLICLSIEFLVILYNICLYDVPTLAQLEERQTVIG